MDQSPQEGGGLDGASRFRQEWREYFETVASEADFQVVKEQDRQPMKPGCHSGHGSYCFVEGKLACSHSPQGPSLSTPPRLGGGFVNKDEDATHACTEKSKKSWARSASE